jgi:hypothetical protein
MIRTTEQVFWAHVNAVQSGDIQGNKIGCHTTWFRWGPM